MALIRRFLLRLLSFLRSGRAESDLRREIAAHLRLLEDRFISEGMPAEAARYAARRAFGGVEQAKEHQRDTRSFRWLAGWSMDLRLGTRMLVRYPGLTLVGGFAIAFGIAVGAAGFEALIQLVAPDLPLADGGRIIGIRSRDLETRTDERRVAHDFLEWRHSLTGVEDLGAFRSVDRNLIVGDGAAEPIQLAEISASAFRLTRVAPFLGRVLSGADEQPGAASVAVIGHDIWLRRFGGDPAVVGRAVHLGTTPTTIVGVMPEGFRFPVAHSAWAPLRLDVTPRAPRAGPELYVFGRLGRGTSRGSAQATLDAIAGRAGMASPTTHARLRPEIVPYAKAFVDVGELALGGLAVNIFVVLFLVLVSANVAALVFARALTRRGEIVLRTALGASRGRIVMQLFAEALVLGGVAAVGGLGCARFILSWWMNVYAAEAGGRLPFWLSGELSATTILYVSCLTVLGAFVAGVLPALRLTGGSLETQLRHRAAGPTGFGGLWTLVIVSQVAATLAFPAAAFFARQHVVGVQNLDVGFAADRYLSARPTLDDDLDDDASPRLRATYEELQRRLLAEPGVAAVAYVDRLPGTTHPERAAEVEGEEGSASPRVNRALASIDYFAAVGAGVLAGRSFQEGDVRAAAPVVIVNQSFVDRLLGSRNAVGRRVRYAAARGQAASPWYAIVGVVPDLGTIHDDVRRRAGIYHPVAPATGIPLNLIVHVRGDAAAFIPRLRAVAAEVDPTMRLHDILRLDDVGDSLWMEMNFLWRLLAIVSGIALLLSLAGIYSVMSFTVSRRTREIGIRLALGADTRRIVTAIFSRALAQVGAGVFAGGLIVVALTQVIAGLSPKEVAGVVAYMVVMFCVCMLACIVPTRRALRIEPTEILKSES